MAHGGKREGAGRPKGFAALEAERQRAYVAEVLVTEWAPIVAKAIEQAKAGDKSAREWISDQAFAKPSQAIDHTTLGEKLPTPILGASTPNG